MKTLLRGAAAAIALSGLFSVSASADLTPTGYSCSLSDVYLVSFGNATACSGWWDGNNMNQDDDVLGVVRGWLSNPTEGDDIQTEGWGTGGTIALGDTYSEFVLALKAGNQFSLYYFAGSGSSVDYDIDGLGHGLSHWTIYSGDETTVPEPGMLLLLSTGLLGMAFVRRREDVA